MEFFKIRMHLLIIVMIFHLQQVFSEICILLHFNINYSELFYYIL